MGYNKKITCFFVLLVWSGLFSCENTNALSGRGSSGADSLDDIKITSTDGKHIVEYEDVYRVPTVIVNRRKFWSGYKNFTSSLKTSSVKNMSPSKETRVSSLLGDKKLVMVTPAIWEDASHFLVPDGDRKNTREYRLFDQLGDFFIHPKETTTQDSPNGVAAFPRWVWGYGEQQDVFMDTFVESQSVYLIIGFPLHKKSSRQALDATEAVKIKELQRGIGNYIIRGRVLLWPFGTSIDHFFSQKLSEVSLQFSNASYNQISTFAFGAQALVTQHRSIAEDTFVQMSRHSSDGFIYSNASNKVLYYPPGAITQSIAYSESGSLDLSIEREKSLFATENSILVIPFLIQKILTKEGDSSQKGFLLRGNPLAMRVFPLPTNPAAPFLIEYPEGITPVFSTPVDKIDLETGSMDSLDSFVSNKGALGVATSYLSSMLWGRSNRKKEEEKKKIAQTIFKISDETPKVEWTQESLSKFIREQLEGTPKESFSWSLLKKIFDKDTSTNNLLRAKKKLPTEFTDTDFESLFDWRKGVAQHSQTKDCSVTPILQYAGFDLIFWPEEDLEYVKSFMTGDSLP